MTFTSLPAHQQARINAAREHYRECNRKLSSLIDQVVACDPWETSEITRLNQAIGVAKFEEEMAWATWDAAIAAINNIPAKATVAKCSYLEAKGYRQEGDRAIWEPQDSSDLDDAFQDNDEPDLHFDADWWIETEEF